MAHRLADRLLRASGLLRPAALSYARLRGRRSDRQFRRAFAI